MNTLSSESCNAILLYVAGTLDDIEQVMKIQKHPGSWRCCLRLTVASQGIRGHVEPWIMTKKETPALRLLIRRWEDMPLIHNILRVRQLGSGRWRTDTRECAIRSCQQQTGSFVPWQGWNGLYGPPEASYKGALAIEGEFAECSVDGQGTIDEWISSQGPHLVVCSVGCLKSACWLREVAYFPAKPWRILRGAPSLETDTRAQMQLRRSRARAISF